MYCVIKHVFVYFLYSNILDLVIILEKKEKFHYDEK